MYAFRSEIYFPILSITEVSGYGPTVHQQQCYSKTFLGPQCVMVMKSEMFRRPLKYEMVIRARKMVLRSFTGRLCLGDSKTDGSLVIWLHGHFQENGSLVIWWRGHLQENGSLVIRWRGHLQENGSLVIWWRGHLQENGSLVIWWCDHWEENRAKII